MKKGDIVAILYVVACVLAVCYFPFELKNGTLSWGYEVNGNGVLNFGAMTKVYPYLMGFIKVALLATFGELIKIRRKTGSYKVDLLALRFVIWGFYGMMFSLAFPLFDKGVKGLMDLGLWPGQAAPAALGMKIWLAFSCSFLINMIFAYPMMLSHEWFNMVLAKQRFVGGAQFMEGIDKHLWGSFIPFSIVWFWIPAHTITFSLPGEYRILMAASLSVALGFLLTFKKK